MENESEGVAAEAAEHGAEAAADHGADAVTDSLGAEVLAEAEIGMPQLDVSNYPNLIFWLILAIGLLYYILTRIAIPRISATLAERNDAISNDIEQAQILKQRAEAADAAYAAALAAARDEAHRITAETKAAINKELESLMAKAEAEIAAKAAESEQRIGEIRDSATRSVEEVARDTTGQIVEMFLPGDADTKAVDAAITERLRG